MSPAVHSFKLNKKTVILLYSTLVYVRTPYDSREFHLRSLLSFPRSMRPRFLTNPLTFYSHFRFIVERLRPSRRGDISFVRSISQRRKRISDGRRKPICALHVLWKKPSTSPLYRKAPRPGGGGGFASTFCTLKLRSFVRRFNRSSSRE